CHEYASHPRRASHAQSSDTPRRRCELRWFECPHARTSDRSDNVASANVASANRASAEWPDTNWKRLGDWQSATSCAYPSCATGPLTCRPKMMVWPPTPTGAWMHGHEPHVIWRINKGGNRY